MSHSTLSSINTLLNKALMTLHLASKDQTVSDVEASSTQINSTQIQRVSVKEKMLGYNLMANYHAHTLHYAMKSLGYLPAPLLERLISYLKGPTSQQYPHANAHLRLLLAINSHLKTPLVLDSLPELRASFAADAVAMQAPKVWQQADATLLSNIKPFSKKGESDVKWQDKTIANADNGDMTVRCYQTNNRRNRFKKASTHNPDKTVMLFLHGGGFCIGDVDTHHEFCHTICAQTGWPVVSVDYRLAPEHAAPTALRDSIEAYAWVAEHCHTLGALPSRIVLAGDSAGGALSILVAQNLTAPTKNAWLDLGIEGQRMLNRLETLPPPLAQMPLYPVTDIETDYPSWELYGEGLLLDHADVAVFGNACLTDSCLPREHILNSPMLGNNSRVCPTYIIAAELDVLRDEACAYAAHLQDYGIPVATRTVLGAPHGFIHFMSIHEGLGQETKHIIHGFSGFVRDVIDTQSQRAA